MKKKIKVREKVLDENDLLAQELTKKFGDNKVFVINVMASPGAGKTTFVKKTVQEFKDKVRVAVVDGDVVDIDLQEIAGEGVPMALANTGGTCHLDATMVSKAIAKLDLEKLDLLIIENVGNLICPMNFKIGANKNVIIASVPEGADKPYKYPGMFKGADVVIVNKMDYTKIEPFDLDYFEKGVRRVNQKVEIFPVSLRTGEGVEKWLEVLSGWLG